MKEKSKKTKVIDVVTFDSATYKNLIEKLDFIEKEIKRVGKEAFYPLSERWIDNEGVCKILNCSKRTLQMYRDEMGLQFYQIKFRMYYKATDIEKFLNTYSRVINEKCGRRISPCKK